MPQHERHSSATSTPEPSEDSRRMLDSVQKESALLQEHTMASLIARLTEEGHVVLPRQLWDALGVKPGDYLSLTPTEHGVLISAAAPLPTGATVREVALALEASLAEQGITEEEQLDSAIAQAKRQAYQRVYGRDRRD